MSSVAAAASVSGRAPADLRRARWATRIQFAVLGLLAGTWGAHIPSVKLVHGLSEFSLSMMLLAAALGVDQRAVYRRSCRRQARRTSHRRCRRLVDVCDVRADPAPAGVMGGVARGLPVRLWHERV